MKIEQLNVWRFIPKAWKQSSLGEIAGLGTGAINYKVNVVFVGIAIFMALSVILTLAVKLTGIPPRELAAGDGEKLLKVPRNAAGDLPPPSHSVYVQPDPQRGDGNVQRVC